MGPCDGEKELFYFMDPGHPLTKTPNYHSSGMEAYKSLFPSEGSPLKIEGTTHYLFQRTAREALSDMSSDPLIVVVLRDPAERVWSSFRYTQNNLARIDNGLSFHKYLDWSLNGERNRVKKHISQHGSAYVLARDVKYGKYIRYLRGWRQAVGPGRLMVLRFTDVVGDSRFVSKRLASELGVDTAFYDDFEFRAKNTTYNAVWRPLHALARQIGQRIPDGVVKQQVKQAYLSLATRQGSSKRTPEDRRALDKLRDYYRPYNKQLAAEFDLDVSHWM
jgi:hypothetical protein